MRIGAAWVLSPSSAEPDRFLKRHRYQEAGVPLYWIVDGEARRWRSGPRPDLFPHIEHHQLRWHPAGAGAPFRLELKELFRAL